MQLRRVWPIGHHCSHHAPCRGPIPIPTSSRPAETSPPLGDREVEADAASTDAAYVRDHGPCGRSHYTAGPNDTDKKAQIEPFSLAESHPLIPASIVEKN